MENSLPTSFPLLSQPGSEIALMAGNRKHWLLDPPAEVKERATGIIGAIGRRSERV